MTCKHLIAICSKTRLPCPHCHTDGQCDEAECVNAVVPTWNELLDIYETAVKPNVKRMGNLRSSFKTLTSVLGQTMDDKVAVTDDQMDAAYATLRTDHEPESIDSIFGALKATTSSRREIKMEYRKRAKQVPNIDTPTIEKKPKPIIQLTEAQRLAIRERITLLRNATLLRNGKTVTDRNRFLWLWFAWNFGMRPIDIGKVKWECIQQHSNGSWWLNYIPTKTAKRGKKAGCKLTDMLIEEIRPFIGAPDEYVIRRCENRIPKSGCLKRKHGEYVGHHATLRKYAIDFMRSIGVDDKKPQYAFRKDCSQQTIKTKGILHEAQLLGHAPKIAMTNYADITKIELKEGL